MYLKNGQAIGKGDVSIVTSREFGVENVQPYATKLNFYEVKLCSFHFMRKASRMSNCSYVEIIVSLLSSPMQAKHYYIFKTSVLNPIYQKRLSQNKQGGYGKGTRKQIFTGHHVIEKAREFNKPTFISFVGLSKYFYSVKWLNSGKLYWKWVHQISCSSPQTSARRRKSEGRWHIVKPISSQCRSSPGLNFIITP